MKIQDIKKTKTSPKNNNSDRINGIKKEVNSIKKKQSYQNKINKSYIANENYNTKSGNSKYTLWIIALISVIFLFFAVSFLFSSAEINITPKTKDFSFNKDFLASKNKDSDNLSYDSIILSGEESKKVLAGEEKDYTESAKGVVLIYNSFNSSPQTFSENTKLEGSNGKIYKTKSKIIVPGMAKNNIPGKARVEIYASEPGQEYNTSPIDFKIVGFKKTSKYEKFYARSVGEISGGIKGKARIVNEQDKEKSISELKEILSEKLFKKAKDQTPNDFLIFRDANFVNIDEEYIGQVSEDGYAEIKIKGTFYGILFNEQNLSKRITTILLGEEDKSDVYISNISDLRLSFENKEIVLFTDATSINFNLSGNLKIVWKVDSNKILSEVLGKKKSDFNQILRNYSNIDLVNVDIKPVWKNSFPENNKKVKVFVNYPK